jgi:hypothetical protein
MGMREVKHRVGHEQSREAKESRFTLNPWKARDDGKAYILPMSTGLLRVLRTNT